MININSVTNVFKTMDAEIGKKRKYIAGFVPDKNADKSSVFTKCKFFEFESESSAGTNKNYEDAIKKARALYGSKVANEIKIDVVRLA